MNLNNNYIDGIEIIIKKKQLTRDCLSFLDEWGKKLYGVIVTVTPKKYTIYFVYACKIKMEAGSVEAGAQNHLENVLSQTEIANIPNPVVAKINNYIDQKFGEYLTSKALHETSKSQIGKYPVFSATHTKLLLV